MLNVRCLDGDLLMIRQDDLLTYFEIIRELGPQLGLVMNYSKSLMWPGGGRDRPQRLPDGVVLSDCNACSVIGILISVDGR